MDFKDLENKTKPEVLKILAETQTKRNELSFKVSAKQHKNVRELRVLKKQIARIMTLLNLGHNQQVKN